MQEFDNLGFFEKKIVQHSCQKYLVLFQMNILRNFLKKLNILKISSEKLFAFVKTGFRQPRQNCLIRAGRSFERSIFFWRNRSFISFFAPRAKKFPNFDEIFSVNGPELHSMFIGKHLGEDFFDEFISLYLFLDFERKLSDFCQSNF